MDIAADDADLLVVTENGWGKRTRVSDYPVKGRGTMGVKTAQLVAGKVRLAGARIVREGYEVMLISDGGTVIRTSIDGIMRSGRATQGVIVMRLREGEQVSSLAPAIGSDQDRSWRGPRPRSTSPTRLRPIRRRPTTSDICFPPPTDFSGLRPRQRAPSRACRCSDLSRTTASSILSASKISPGARPGSRRR